ncbi:MAG: hypothetical protein K2P93_00290 [Alphaproteobacteria bacterium]|nr:hypothetical protein [Alphaproteobacteria bacterium]
MMSLPHHMDNVPSVLQRLPEGQNESMAEERDENLSPLPFENASDGKKRSLRFIIIREELVDLTGGPLTAAILGQMLHWCQRAPDFDLYVGEEKANPPQDKFFLQYGWFYKANQEFIEETMLRVTLATFRRYLSFLISRGWIQTRTHPKRKWDRRSQYRMNLRKLSADLQKKGHILPGFEVYGIFPHSPKNICTEQKQKQKKASSGVENSTHSKERQS